MRNKKKKYVNISNLFIYLLNISIKEEFPLILSNIIQRNGSLNK